MRCLMIGVVGVISLVVFFAGCTKTVEPIVPAVTDGIMGGMLYDKYWASETGFTGNTAVFEKYPEFFRCASCHGWELKGNEGGFANRAVTKTQPNIYGNLRTIITGPDSIIFNGIKIGSSTRRSPIDTVSLATYDPTSYGTGDQMPNYAAILTDKQISDLVKYIKYELVDVDQVYTTTITGNAPAATVTYSDFGKGGNAVAGNSIYTKDCASCHEANGKKIALDNGLGVGGWIRQNPAKGIHKIKFGALGSNMKSDPLTLQQFKDLYKEISDASKYPN